jgi:hypothetical protein
MLLSHWDVEINRKRRRNKGPLRPLPMRKKGDVSPFIIRAKIVILSNSSPIQQTYDKNPNV